MTQKGPSSGSRSESTDGMGSSTIQWGAASKSQEMKERLEVLPGPFQVSMSMYFPTVTVSDQTVFIPRIVHRKLLN